MDDLEIRELKLTDLPAVIKIEKESFSCPWSYFAFIKELNNKSAYYLVGLLDDEIVTYIGSWLLDTQIHITTLATKSDYRGQGIATEILHKLLNYAKKLGKAKASLEVRVSNQVAQKMYRKEGFFNIARKRGYYKDNGEDAFVMWKQLK